MKYFLLNDDCDHCRYVQSAFTLLKLPLTRLQFAELKNDVIPDSAVVLICPHIEENHLNKVQKTLKGYKSAVITFALTQDAYPDRYAHVLSMPFSKYELKNALIACTHHQQFLPTFPPVSHPIIEKLVGQGEALQKIKLMIQQVASSDATVLILGESGTGKDVIASCIHYLSHRKEQVLIPINCGAIPTELMESELFGHEKGAFTGALARRPGRFEMANKGSLFLDEIGDMPLTMQVKLLRVLQDQKIERVGGNASIEVDVRLIAATNKNLEALILANQFREDLFYRLNVFPIQVPSLRERSEDIPLLIDFYLEKLHDRLKHRVCFSEAAKELLCGYSWPGNIRELQNFLERMVILYPDQVVDDKHIDVLYKQKKQQLVMQYENH